MVPIVTNFKQPINQTLTKRILYENDVKLLKFKGSPVSVDLWYVWIVRFWLSIPEMNTSRKSMEWLICFSIVNLMLACLLSKTFKEFNESCHCLRQLECQHHIINKI